MSTQALLDKIASARDEQVAIVEAASAKTIAAIEFATAIEVKEIESAASAASEKEVVQIKRAALSKARQNGKLAVQTARREAFDAILDSAEKTITAEDPANVRLFADQKPVLEMELAKQIG